MKIFILSKRETAHLMDLVRSKWPDEITPRAKNFKVYQIEEGKSLLEADNFVAIQTRGSVILPFLGKPELLDHFPSIDVDKGAVHFVCNGAKVMRPGITRFSVFKKDDIVVVRDYNYKKALAVGLALVDNETAASMATGYVIDNMHYISDKFWEASKSISWQQS